MGKSAHNPPPAVGEINADTRTRLIEAAGEVFADEGFERATVRQICAKAGANVAAINYHFRDKESLYAETLRHAHSYSEVHYPPAGGLPLSAPAEQRLQAFINSFLFKTLDPNRPTWHGRLITREMTEPTPALDLIVEGGVKPQFRALCAIVQELGPSMSKYDVEACAGSVIGQSLHYHWCHALIMRLFDSRETFPFTIEELSKHVTRFSLAAIGEIERQSQAARRAGGAE